MIRVADLRLPRGDTATADTRTAAQEDRCDIDAAHVVSVGQLDERCYPASGTPLLETLGLEVDLRSDGIEASRAVEPQVDLLDRSAAETELGSRAERDRRE